MAANKFYSYYLRGGQIALIEQDVNDNSRWKSPASTVTDGLEIEYAYSPRYTIPPIVTDSLASGVDNKFFINGWAVIHDADTLKNYLGFLRSEEDAIVGWGGAPTHLAVNDNFVIRGSNKWNGLHKVKSVSDGATMGILTTFTEVSGFGSEYIANAQIDFAADETVFDGGSGYYLADIYANADYIWILGAGDAKNNGLFSISSVTQSSTAASSKITLGTRYSVVQSDDSDTYATGLTNEYSAAAALSVAAEGSGVYMYKAYRDFCYMITDVNVLDDESDTIDLPEYLAKALVYYVKAKVAEDQRDIELKEYFMREFRKMLEKQESSKIWGARLVTPASNAIR